jgi:serine/threonine protein kinase
LTGEVLGEGSYGRVTTCVNMFTEAEYAVKVISKKSWCFSRAKILKEIEVGLVTHPRSIMQV